MTGGRGRRRFGATALVVLLTVLTVLVSGALAVAALLVAASASSTLPVAYTAAVIVGLLGALLGARLVARPARLRYRNRYTAGVGVAAVALLVLLASLTLLRPLPSTTASRRPPAVPSGVRYWQLPTGSRLAYLEAKAVGEAASTPIVVVGGGPGESDVSNASQLRFFSGFARLGYDVYSYDQAGAGLSSRFADPSTYTVRRHVDDLEAIRERIGARRMILMGSSWGGSLAASYLARYPRHVAKVVFTSPAPIDYARWTDASWAVTALPPTQRHRADALLPDNPRFLLWYALSKVNPDAAHDLVSDKEADAYFDEYLHIIAGSTVCNPTHLPDQYETGNGFYDNMFTSRSASAGAQSGARAALARVHTPALILTGGCNYVPWAVTHQYATTLPDSTLVCFAHAGHVIYLDQPDSYRRTIEAFLRGGRLPVSPWTIDRPCTTHS